MAATEALVESNGRNDVSGTVLGATVQAHTISGDVHIHPAGDQERVVALYEELGQVRRQLVDSLAAERDLTRAVWALQVVLMRAQDVVVRLTWERDHLVDEAERRNAELARARESERRVEQQLDRARADRLTALRVAHAATAKVRALEAELRGGAGAHGSRVVAGAADPGIGPDTIDAYLAEQGARLDRLAEALGELRVPTASAFDGTTRRMLTTSLVRALVRLPSLSDAAGRGLATRLLADRLGAPVTVEESPDPGVHLSNLVLFCLDQASGVTALLEVLELFETTDSEPFLAVREVVDSWSADDLLQQEELARLLAMLAGVVLPDVAHAYRDVAGPAAPALPAGTSYAEVLASLAGLAHHSSGVPLPLVFLERIALAAGSELADGLRRWNDRHAGRIGLDAELTAVRAGLLSDHAA
ncbi:effector-associated domain 2-containing protein [Saccharothrix lopnurensis]|uniref:Uncharacterized protein n=1 Tax=Saccharothrix lopnurensis TaxID=1670621 RepID=A0ABW1NZ40_9PSEU